MLSVIIPTYRNPAYLDLCIKSAVEGQVGSNEIIIVVDGFPQESNEVLKKWLNKIHLLVFQQNQGMQAALNAGVFNATSNKIFIMNDDNVFAPEWDVSLSVAFDPLTVSTIEQIEPSPSIFNFPVADCGRTAETFNFQQFVDAEAQLRKTTLPSEMTTDAGKIFPFLIDKRWYMAVGGFDTLYRSPFWCDVDFWTKLELLGNLSFLRWRNTHLYHFGSKATKGRTDGDKQMFVNSEHPAAQTFFYKWGFIPDIVKNVTHANTKLPNKVIRGITFDGEGETLITDTGESK